MISKEQLFESNPLGSFNLIFISITKAESQQAPTPNLVNGLS